MSHAPPLALRSQEKYRFDHRDMDFYFSWILGRQAVAGSDARECFATAERIADGEPESWQEAWPNLAGRTEQEGARALQEGDLARARGAYLRACTYYRAPLFMTDPANLLFREHWRKMQACFRQAAALFDPPFEAVEVPYQGKTLPGYFCRAKHDRGRRPTLIIVGGIETFAEDLYFMAAPAALSRGLNVLAVDLPGQGLNPDAGLFLEARADRGVLAVVDYAAAHPEVDGDYLALFGFSWGGHIVLKGAVNEPRIAALIANPATHNMFSSTLAQQSSGGRTDPVVRRVFQQLAWRFGLSLGNVPARLARALEFMLYAKADVRKIPCPTLCLASESEAKVTLEQTRQTTTGCRIPASAWRSSRKSKGGCALSG